MEVHRPVAAPDHVHGCPVHPGGSDAASKNAEGKKQSDACFWDEHDAQFKNAHKDKYDKAKK